MVPRGGHVGRVEGLAWVAWAHGLHIQDGFDVQVRRTFAPAF